MTKVIKKKLLYVLLFIMFFMIWGRGIYYGQYIKENYQSVSVRIKKSHITKKELIRALENEKEKGIKEIPFITAWNCLEKQNIRNKELETVAFTRVIEVYGDMRQVHPMELIEGNLVNSVDYEGCVIDENLAYLLFRTSNAVGSFLTYQNKQFCIRGIIKSPEPMFLVQIDKENNAYSNLELVYNNKENGRLLTQDFMIQNNLSNSYTMIEGCFYAWILEVIYQVPIFFLSFCMLFYILKSIWKRKTIPLQVGVLLLGVIILGAGLKWIIDFRIYIPERLIPTRWSSFSFWINKYTEFQNQLKQIVYLLPVPKDVILIQYAKRCICYIFLVITGIVVFVTHKTVFVAEKSGFKWSFLSIMVEGIAIFLLYKSGKVFHLTKGYLGIIPLFIIFLDFINRDLRFKIH